MITLMLMCFPRSFHVAPKTSPASLMTERRMQDAEGGPVLGLGIVLLHQLLLQWVLLKVGVKRERPWAGKNLLDAGVRVP